MEDKLLRVGTIYIPVSDAARSAAWYAENLNAQISYQDEDKAIVNLANMSFFLINSKGQSSNFTDIHGAERFALTFEVNGLEALEKLHSEFLKKEIQVGAIEDRGHTGRNFVFYDPDGNKFDVWSELSPKFREKYIDC